ncbi:hypothetical protein LMG24238_02107 [Paraburkholderia sediminicola]|uniref:Uncharacterized protein n=1 Tax=Paraburkholderia sediminicola TaxID=458836 RepID=A0A6J5AMD0_9BURK|nr:hypothetical protein LMG24238_02107 [Paraburkholderia sediminicola]
MLKFLKRLFSNNKQNRRGPSQTPYLPTVDLSSPPNTHVSDHCRTDSSAHGGHHSSSHSFDCPSDGGGHSG